MCVITLIVLQWWDLKSVCEEKRTDSVTNDCLTTYWICSSVHDLPKICSLWGFAPNPCTEGSLASLEILGSATFETFGTPTMQRESHCMSEEQARLVLHFLTRVVSP